MTDPRSPSEGGDETSSAEARGADERSSAEHAAAADRAIETRSTPVRVWRSVWAGAGLATAELRSNPLRTALAIVAIALAVLAVTLLAGTGVGVFETGQAQFDAADRDLWITAGPTSISPASGGFENALLDSRSVANDVEAREDVRNAAPIAFEGVRVDAGDGEWTTIVATGVPATSGGTVRVEEGEHFSDPGRHYADGSYDGELTHEVIVDRSTARQLDVEVGDQLRIGGSVDTARAHEFTVVGISETMSDMLGAPTVTLPLDEFHTVTGSTGTEPATFVTVTVEDDADPEAVQADLEAEYPDLAVRTNEEQLTAVLGSMLPVLAAGVTLVGLAIVAGVALTGNLLALLVHQQRRALAALRAQGCSRRFVATTVTWQGLVLGIGGGLLGLLLTVPAIRGANLAASVVVGFDGLAVVEPWILVLGGGIALVVGSASAAVVGYRAVGSRPLAYLR